jgi:hypothetical protein
MKIRNLLWRCAGANVGILARCETDHSRYDNIGATILMTALLATVSMAFAMYSIFDSYIVSVAVALLWGSMIFVMDRTIVTSMRKAPQMNIRSQGGESAYGRTKWWGARIWEDLRELIFVLIRFAVAILVSLVISKPLEIKIFEGRLQVELENMKAEQWKIDSIRPSNESGIPLKEQLLDGLQKEDSNLSKRIASNQKSAQYLSLEQNHRECIAKITPEINKKYQDIQYFRSLIDQKKGSTIWLESPTGIKSMRDWNQAISQANSDIKNLQAKCSPIEVEMQAERKRYDTDLRLQYQANQQSLSAQKQSLQSARIQADAKFGVLKQNRDQSFNNSIIPQIEALDSLKSHEPSIWWTSLLITLLFIVVEISPVLAKLLSKRGDYDDALEAYQVQQWLARQADTAQRISVLNVATENARAEEERHRRALEQRQSDLAEDRLSARKTKVELDTKKQAAAVEKELASYSDLVERIALAQKEIALMQIEQWRKEQVGRLSVKG